MRRKKKSRMMLGLLIAVIALGVGYAAITGVNILVNGSASLKANGDFRVRFVRPESSETAIDNPTENAITISGYNADESAMNVSGMSASITDDTHATFQVGALDEVGEYVDFTYTVVNESDEGIDAELSLEVADENELSDYFLITKSIGKNRITSNETTTLTLRVKLIEQPKLNDVEGTFKITLTATPVNASEEPSTPSEPETPTTVTYSLGQLVQYDPVENTSCTSGDTCYKWRVITVDDNAENENIKLQMDHNLINKGAFSSTGLTNKFASYGPDVLLTDLAMATSSWDESLLLNFQYDTSASNASYGTLTCTSGSCTITGNNTPIATNVKARVITAEEIRDIAMTAGAPEESVAGTWTLANKENTGKYYLSNINYPLGNSTSSTGNGSRELSWLVENTTSYSNSGATDNTYDENNNGYYTLSPVLASANSMPSSWVVYKFGNLSTYYVDNANSIGARPVITIDKSVLN